MTSEPDDQPSAAAGGPSGRAGARGAVDDAGVGARRSGVPLQTLSRGLQVLKFVAAQPQLVRLRDVAQAFGIERSVALRLLQSLEAEGFLTKHDGLKAYAIGPALEAIARPRPFVERLAVRVGPLLADLTAATGQTSHLATLEGGEAVLRAVRKSDGPIVVQMAPGAREALCGSAIGKAIFAFLPPAEQRVLLSRAVATGHRPAADEEEALLREAERIRAAGFACDGDGGPLPLRCIAAPVLDASGRAVASVGISVVAAFVAEPLERKTEWIDRIRRCARTAADGLDA